MVGMSKVGMSKSQASARGTHRPLGALGNSAAVRFSVAERKALGKALRGKVPRRDHGEYVPAPGRRDPVSILEAQGKARLSHLVPIRYGRMLASPFAFLRGSAAVMAGDLAKTPTTGLTVQACGDAHVANFGVFASAERNLIFAINDFDETLPGPWEWDLKRLAASAVVCMRFVGGDAEEAEAAARAVVKSYRERMREYAEMGHLELWYSRIDEGNILPTLSAKARRRAEKIISKAELAPGVVEIDSFIEQCGLFGWALALAHAKTGDPAMIAGYAGKSEVLDEAIARFAFAYADQTERDYETLGKAARTRRISVVRGR